MDFYALVGNLTREQTVELTKVCLNELVDDEVIEIVKEYAADNDLVDELILQLEDA